MRLITSYIAVIFLASAISSCDRQLDALPKNAKVDGTAITDEKSAQTALNGVYYRLANVTGDNITDWTNHQVWGGMLSPYIGYGFGAFPDEQNNNESSSYAPSEWVNNYLIINSANGVIGAVNGLADNLFTENRKNEILAEARFLRGYANYKLLTFFGEWNKPGSAFGVLLRDELSTLSNIPKARSSVDESYSAILGDLDFAIENAVETNASYYASKWAAMALKMRVLIARGQENDYTEVISLGNAILHSGKYELEPKLKDLFYVKGLTSKEVILGIKPQPNQEAFYYILSRAWYPAQSTLYVAHQDLKDLFTGDPRGEWMIGPATPYQAYSPDTYYFLKYIPFGTSPTQNSETSYAFRLSEVYLLMAEATIRSGGDLQTAKDLIKTVMSKGGVTDFSAVDNASNRDELLLQNYYEVARCLTAEDGIEWTTLMRLPFETVKQLKPTITAPRQFYFPIPSDEFRQNPAIGDQNPGYNK